MRILIVGASGLLGKKLLKILSYTHNVGGTYSTRPYENCKHLDITDNDAVEQFITFYQPEVVVHTAAIKNADFCEENKKLAWSVNVEGTKNIVDSCKKHSIKLIYISSDYIFEGDKGPYDEKAIPNPVNFYGLTKLEGERIIKEELADYVIIRPTILYGYNDGSDKTFISEVRAALENGGTLYVDDKIIKYPLLIDDLTKLIIYLLEKNEFGTFHIGGIAPITRYKWAKKIAKVYNLNEKKIVSRDRASQGEHAAKPFNVKLVSNFLNPKISSIETGLKYTKMQENCFFKLLYSGSAEAKVLGNNINVGRIRLSEELGKDETIVTDAVVPIPNTGTIYAVGFSRTSGIPLSIGIVKRKYTRRTLFDDERERKKQLKENMVVIEDLVKDKSITLIDETIFTCSTLHDILPKLKNAGCKEVHLRMPAPPVRRKCEAREHSSDIVLNASCLSDKEIKDMFKLNSFKYLSLEKIKKMYPNACLKCFAEGSGCA
jgi:dTDP-4-dehydrorhamnose reductase